MAQWLLWKQYPVIYFDEDGKMPLLTKDDLRYKKGDLIPIPEDEEGFPIAALAKLHPCPKGKENDK